MRKIFPVLLFIIPGVFTNAQISDTIYIQTENGKIHTVLTRPDKSENYVLAVIIPGSGPTDLNGNQPSLKNNSLLFLSDALVSNNIATVRFDKRGIAKSSYQDFTESDMSVDLYAEDVILLIRHFMQQGFKDIYLIGHSEGSLIGLISMQSLKLKGFVSLCGAGNPAGVILKKQLKPQLPPELFSQTESIIDSLENGMQVSFIPPALQILFRTSVQPYLISWFKYDPASLVRNIKCPVLIVQGGKDIQVDLQEAELLSGAAPESRLVVISDMNHVLKTISGGINENTASYANPDLPVNEELIKNIVEFIK